MDERLREQDFFLRTARLNLIAAAAVVYIHAENYAAFGISSGAAFDAEKKLIGLAAFAVPYFFLLSAFLFYRNFTMDQLLPKWKRRARGLLVPYLIWNALYLILFAVLPRIPAVGSILNAAPAPLTLSSVLSGVFLHTYDGMMWYVRILILYTLLAPAFYYILRVRYLGPAVTLALFALMIGRAPFPLPIEYMNWQNLFYYALGALIGLRWPKLPLMEVSPPLRFAGAALSILLPVYQYFVGTGLYALFMAASLFLAFSKPGQDRAAYHTSFFLYASHMLVLSLVKKLQFALLPKTEIFMLLEYLTAPLLVILIVVPLALLIKKYAPKLWRVSTGNR